MTGSTPFNLAALATSLPPGVVITDADAVARYRHDRAGDTTAATPAAVVLAESTPHVQTAVRWAAQHRVPIVPRGAGTGLSGGAAAIDGCVVISTERMREVLIDPLTRIAVVQPGLLNAELKAAAAAAGLWYPPDPASTEICTIGGNVATNAGGLCCVKYGVTADYVLGMEVVLGDGRAVQLGGPRLKDVAGLSLVKLFVGSEGVLGIITRVTLRLLPPQPPSRTVVAYFADREAAAGAVLDIASRIRPSMLEYMDSTSINAVEDLLGMGLDRGAAAMLVARSDDQDPEGREVSVMLEAFRRRGATRSFEADAPLGATYEHARRIVIPAVEAMGSLLLEDVGVGIPQLADLVSGVEDIARTQRVTVAFIAHAGDGNTHPLIVFDRDDADQTARAEAAYGAIMDLAIRLGGTITGEHGVGRTKRPWLATQIGADALELSMRVKEALDPAWILNPGAIFAPGGRVRSAFAAGASSSTSRRSSANWPSV